MRGCVFTADSRNLCKQVLLYREDLLLGIFEWECGGGLADDGGNRLHSCAREARGMHTQSFTTHTAVIWGTPKVTSRDVA